MLLYRVWRYDERYRFPVPFSACTTNLDLYGGLGVHGGAFPPFLRESYYRAYIWIAIVPYSYGDQFGGISPERHPLAKSQLELNSHTP